MIYVCPLGSHGYKSWALYGDATGEPLIAQVGRNDVWLRLRQQVGGLGDDVIARWLSAAEAAAALGLAVRARGAKADDDAIAVAQKAAGILFEELGRRNARKLAV